MSQRYDFPNAHIEVRTLRRFLCVSVTLCLCVRSIVGSEGLIQRKESQRTGAHRRECY